MEELEEGVDVFAGKVWCSNCRGTANRKPLHCKVRGGVPIVTCNPKQPCECKCRTHYACTQGRLHPYGQKCNCIDYDSKIRDPAKEQQFEDLLTKLGIHPDQIDKKLNQITPNKTNISN